jgi:hypothetical protein
MVFELINEGYQGDLDTISTFVVRAGSEEEARALAARHAMDEGKSVWLSPTYSTCRSVDPAGPTGVLAFERKGF